MTDQELIERLLEMGGPVAMLAAFRLKVLTAEEDLPEGTLTYQDGRFRVWLDEVEQKDVLQAHPEEGWIRIMDPDQSKAPPDDFATIIKRGKIRVERMEG